MPDAPTLLLLLLLRALWTVITTRSSYTAFFWWTAVNLHRALKQRETAKRHFESRGSGGSPLAGVGCGKRQYLERQYLFRIAVKDSGKFLHTRWANSCVYLFMFAFVINGHGDCFIWIQLGCR